VLEHAKHTWNGLFEWLDLLRKEGLRPARSLGGVGRASPDDVLDATAVAWSAQRLAGGSGASLPVAPSKDPATGRAIGIWYGLRHRVRRRHGRMRCSMAPSSGGLSSVVRMAMVTTTA
jgi:hypothetical protein